MFRSLAVACFAVACHSYGYDFVHDEAMWGPSDSVKALDSVIVAVDKVVNNPHLSPDNLVKAKHVAEVVKGDIEAVEHGNLTKQEAHEKVGAALKELTNFATVLRQAPVDRLAALKKELAEKKAELMKDNRMLKLLKLKKELAEKKLALQNLLAQKAAAQNGRHAEESEANKTTTMVKSLLGLARSLTNASKRNSSLQAALSLVRSREHEVADTLAHIEATHNKSEAALDAFGKTDASAKTAGKDDALAKGASMLKHLRMQERHVFKKALALKEAEMKELKTVESEVQKGDVVGLKKVLGKMQKESSAMQAATGTFLH